MAGDGIKKFFRALVVGAAVGLLLAAAAGAIITAPGVAATVAAWHIGSWAIGTALTTATGATHAAAWGTLLAWGAGIGTALGGVASIFSPHPAGVPPQQSQMQPFPQQRSAPLVPERALAQAQAQEYDNGRSAYPGKKFAEDLVAEQSSSAGYVR